MAIKKYTNGSWVSASYRKYGTETDTITTLPATIIGDGTPITSYTIKGNMEQNGTPTPSSPIYPSECGDLVTSGEHAGQYKLPITLGNTTTDIYLGEVQSTRRVKKLVLTGEEGFNITDSTTESGTKVFSVKFDDIGMTDLLNYDALMSRIPYPFFYSTHFKQKSNRGVYTDIKDGEIGANTVSVETYNRWLVFGSSAYTTVADLKSYLAAQYAAGTPVIVWYVLANEETGVVNEPLMKIGDYVDSVSGTGLATSGTAQEFDINTTLKPSEVDMTYHGWHEHEDTKYST